MISNELKTKLLSHYKQLQEHEDFRLYKNSKKYVLNFLSKFSPELLKEISGKELLNTLHAPKASGVESLTYWLEHKNHEETFADIFGGITVGSAGAFRVYYNEQTSSWKDRNHKKINEDRAIEIAEENMKLLKVKFTGCILSKNKIPVDILLDRYYPLENIHSVTKAFLEFQKEFVQIQNLITRLPVKRVPHMKKNSIYFLQPHASCLFLHETIGHPLEYFGSISYLANKNIKNQDLHISINSPNLVKNLYNFDDDGIEPSYTTLIHSNPKINIMTNLNTILAFTDCKINNQGLILTGNSRSEFYESPQVRQGHITIEEGQNDLNEEKENFTGISFYNCRDGGYYNYYNKAFIVFNGIFYKKGNKQFLINNFHFESNPLHFLESICETGNRSESIIFGCGKNSSIIPVGVKAPCLKIIL